MTIDASRRAPATSAQPLGTEPADISIRPIATHAEFRACVELQAAVWGPEYTDSVPASLLQVATYIGGVVLGAFTTSDELVGFVFGLTGVERGQGVHWSHLLGVRDSVRNAGVGRLLKEAQRHALAAQGVRRMSWTFDPLVSRNAHLNLNRLGARVVSYAPDMYGTTTSPLHYGIATDRLVVSLETDAMPPVRSAPSAPITQQPVLTPEHHDGDLLVNRSAPPAALWIEIPHDLHEILEHAPAAGAHWRTAVREHFQWALAHGYEVECLQCDPVTARSFYLLSRKEAA